MTPVYDAGSMTAAELDDLVEPVPSPLPRMTEEEFVAWCTEERRAEWVDGEVVLMDAVNTGHGQLVTFLNKLVGGFVEEQYLGDILNEPVVVRLPRQRRRRSPDLFFFTHAQRDRLLAEHFEGPPTQIVEVVSPDDRRRDTVVKFAEYEAAGVPEYWIADRELRSFVAFGLATDGRYAPLPEVDGTVYSAVLPGLFFRPEWVWQLRFPKPGPLLAVMAAERTKRLAHAGNPAR